MPGSHLIRRVHAHRLKNLRIFAQAVALKPGLGELAAMLVSRQRVKLAKPTLVFPTHRADIHTFGGECRRLFFHRLTVEGHVVRLQILRREVNPVHFRRVPIFPALRN
jgi:hypothetical protein